MIYLDNAATSWPKPDCVTEAMVAFAQGIGASPGRSGHSQSNEAERIRFDAREAIAHLFGVADPTRVVFTANGTTALNIALYGLLAPGSHVITTGLEHNAVMRPLRHLEQLGASISIAGCRPDSTLETDTIRELIRAETRLIVVNHASNVCGTVLPIAEIGDVARSHGIPLLVDAAQTAGCWPIDMEADNIDLLAFTGHKALLGPTGTGGLVFGASFDPSSVTPLIRGGTGSRSEHEYQPDFLPDRFEAGTPNMLGLAGLAASSRYLVEHGVEQIVIDERRLTQRLIDGLSQIRGVRLQGHGDASRQIAVVSFVIEGFDAADIAHHLDERFDIMCRPGLHCAPLAHRTLGTAPDGTVRFALGLSTTDSDVDAAIGAVATFAMESRCG